MKLKSTNFSLWFESLPKIWIASLWPENAGHYQRIGNVVPRNRYFFSTSQFMFLFFIQSSNKPFYISSKKVIHSLFLPHYILKVWDFFPSLVAGILHWIWSRKGKQIESLEFFFFIFLLNLLAIFPFSFTSELSGPVHEASIVLRENIHTGIIMWHGIPYFYSCSSIVQQLMPDTCYGK